MGTVCAKPLKDGSGADEPEARAPITVAPAPTTTAHTNDTTASSDPKPGCDTPSTSPSTDPKPAAATAGPSSTTEDVSLSGLSSKKESVSRPAEPSTTLTPASPATPPPAPHTALSTNTSTGGATSSRAPRLGASTLSGGSARNLAKRAHLPTLDLKRARPLAALSTSRSGVSAGSGGQTGGLTSRLNQVDTDGLLVTEQHRKEAKLVHFSKECSEIVPWLFVSGEAVASDLSVLQSKGITCVVNAAGVACESPFESSGLSYLTLYLHDSPRAEIVPYFYQVVEVVEAVRSRGGKVLVHCHQGVSRSGTLAIAYVMWAFGLSYDDGHDFVRSRRGTVSPNPGFLCQLMEWGSELAAVSMHGSPCCSLAYVQDSGATPTSSGPRSRTSSCADADTANAALMYEVVPLETPGWMSGTLAEMLGLGAPTSSRVAVTHVLQLCRRSTDRRVTPPVVSAMDSTKVYVVRVPLKASSASAPSSASGGGVGGAGGSPGSASTLTVDAAFVRVGASVPSDVVDGAVSAGNAEAKRWHSLKPAPLVPPAHRVDASPLLDWSHVDTSTVGGRVVPSVSDPRLIREGVNDGLLGAVVSALGGGSAGVSSQSLPDSSDASLDAPPALKRDPAPDVGPSATPTATADGTDGGGAAGGEADDTPIRPSLHKWSDTDGGSWERLGVYDDDDLDDDCLLVLLPAPGVAGGGFVWTGSAFSGMDAEAVTGAVESLVASVPGLSAPVPTQTACQGSEPDAFWEMFESGY